MANLIDVKVPDLGDSKGVPIIEILVKEGEAIGKDSVLLVLETPEGLHIAGSLVPTGEDAQALLASITPDLQQVRRNRAALLAKADDALYLSKRDGRDRVSVQDATGEPQAALSG